VIVAWIPTDGKIYQAESSLYPANTLLKLAGPRTNQIDVSANARMSLKSETSGALGTHVYTSFSVTCVGFLPSSLLSMFSLLFHVSRKARSAKRPYEASPRKISQRVVRSCAPRTDVDIGLSGRLSARRRARGNQPAKREPLE